MKTTNLNKTQLRSVLSRAGVKLSHADYKALTSHELKAMYEELLNTTTNEEEIEMTKQNTKVDVKANTTKTTEEEMTMTNKTNTMDQIVALMAESLKGTKGAMVSTTKELILPAINEGNNGVIKAIKAELREVKAMLSKVQAPASPKVNVTAPQAPVSNVCSKCNKAVTEKVMEFSLRNHKAVLCYSCQPGNNKKKATSPAFIVRKCKDCGGAIQYKDQASATASFKRAVAEGLEPGYYHSRCAKEAMTKLAAVTKSHEENEGNPLGGPSYDDSNIDADMDRLADMMAEEACKVPEELETPKFKYNPTPETFKVVAEETPAF